MRSCVKDNSYLGYRFFHELLIRVRLRMGSPNTHVQTQFKRDNTKGTAQVMSGLVGGLVQAADKHWITDEKAKTILNAIFSQLGVDTENEEKEKEADVDNEK